MVNLRGEAVEDWLLMVVVLAPLVAGELVGAGLERDGFIGGDGVAVMTGIWTHF